MNKIINLYKSICTDLRMNKTLSSIRELHSHNVSNEEIAKLLTKHLTTIYTSADVESLLKMIDDNYFVINTTIVCLIKSFLKHTGISDFLYSFTKTYIIQNFYKKKILNIIYHNKDSNYDDIYSKCINANINIDRDELITLIHLENHGIEFTDFTSIKHRFLEWLYNVK